jgi:hypothetical protein
MGDLTRDSIYPSQQHLDPVKAFIIEGITTGVLHYLKAKEELWKFKYFTMQKYYLQKNPLKDTKIL